MALAYISNSNPFMSGLSRKWLNSSLNVHFFFFFNLTADVGWKTNCHFLQNVSKQSNASYVPISPQIYGYRLQCHGAIIPRGRNATDPICYIRATALGLSVSWSISKQHRSFSSKAIENSFRSGVLRTEIKGPSCSSNYRKSLVCCSSNCRKSLVTV